MIPSRRLAACLLTAAAGALALGACSTSGGSTAPTASAPSAASAAVSAAASVAASTVPSASPSTPVPAAAAPAPTASASAAGCQNLAAGPALKASVTEAHRAWAHLVHIQPVPGGFYYGRCGSVEYAGTQFQPAPNATYNDQVALQDDGGTMMYYARSAGGGWRHVASSGIEPWLGCTKLRAIPHALAVLWHDCPVAMG